MSELLLIWNVRVTVAMCDETLVIVRVSLCLYVFLSLSPSPSFFMCVNGTASVARHSRHIHRGNIPNPNLSLAPWAATDEGIRNRQPGRPRDRHKGQKGQYSLWISWELCICVSITTTATAATCLTDRLFYLFWCSALILILAWTACTRELHTRYNERY